MREKFGSSRGLGALCNGDHLRMYYFRARLFVGGGLVCGVYASWFLCGVIALFYALFVTRSVFDERCACKHGAFGFGCIYMTPGVGCNGYAVGGFFMILFGYWCIYGMGNACAGNTWETLVGVAGGVFYEIFGVLDDMWPLMQSRHWATGWLSEGMATIPWGSWGWDLFTGLLRLSGAKLADGWALLVGAAT